MRKAMAVVLLMLAAGAAMAKPRRVWDVKAVTAKLSGNEITVVAKGRVNTGGWTNPQLVQIGKTSTTITYEFVAEPPPAGTIVTQGFVNVEAAKTTPPLLPPFPKKVTVKAAKNSKTVSVTK